MADSRPNQDSSQGLAPAPTEPDFNRSTGNWVLATVILGSAMAFIDGSGVNIAIPVIQQQFAADTAAMQWVVESYVVILAAFTLIGGALCDQYGRRRCYAIGMVLFAIASLLCANAADVQQLIIARGLQGIGGALLIPGGLALLGGYFPAIERGRAIGTWAAFGAITGMCAPLLAGWLVEQYSWRWIFLINLPLSLIALTLLYRKVPESRDPDRSGQPDWSGGLLASAGLALLVFAMVEAPRIGFDHRWVIVALICGCLFLGLFITTERRREARGATTMLPLSLFQSSVFSGINLATLLLYTSLNGIMFFLPFYLINVAGFTPLQAGGSFLPMSLGIFLLSRWAGNAASHNPRPALVIGPLFVAAAYLLMAYSTQIQPIWLGLLPGVALLGIGMGFCVAPITNVALGAVASRQSGIASGVNNAVARVASVVAIALFGILLTSSFNQTLEQGLIDSHADAQLIEYFDHERTKLGAAKPPAQLPAQQQEPLQQLIKQAFGDGFQHLCFVALLLALATSLTCWLSVPKQWQTSH